MNPDQPYQWPRQTGSLTAPLLRDYASWLFPRLDLEWESPGIIRRTPQKARSKPEVKPYVFRKSQGWLHVSQDLRPFARHVLARLKPWSDRVPFLPARRHGWAQVSDLLAFAGHVDLLLRKKKEEQSTDKNASSS